MITEPLVSEIAIVRGYYSAHITDIAGQPVASEIDSRRWRRDMRIAGAVLGWLEAVTQRPRQMVIVHPQGYGQ